MAKSKKAATPPAAASAKRNKGLYALIGVVVLVVLGGIAYFTTGSGAAATAPVTRAMDPSEIQQAQGVPMGNDTAAVLVTEFADFQCPACANYVSFSHPLMKERLIDTGIIRLERYDFPIVGIHQHAFLAARAARCAEDQGKFWEFHDVLYARQPTWAAQGDPSGDFETYAEQVGLSASEFRQCLRSDQHAEEVTRNLRLGESLGVSGTPTLFVNGVRMQPRDYRELEASVYEAAGLPALTPAN